MTDLPTYHCPRVAQPIAVDGDIQKPAWRAVPPAWLLPATGAAARTAHWDPSALFADAPGPPLAPRAEGDIQPTALRLCWSETHLYVAFQCSDADIWGGFTMRDEDLFEEEVVEAFLSPTADLRRYYEIEWSPLNVVFDATVWCPELSRTTMVVDRSWDCPGMESAVVVRGAIHATPPASRGEGAGSGPDGGAPLHLASPGLQPLPGWWSVEVAIPFAAFPEAGTPRPGDVWRGNFYRIDRADPPEFTAWSPTLEVPPNFHVPARFGYIVFEG